ncbi:MAG: hypothetical protein GY873_30225 [Bosea sp.]|uniref:DUF6440 family protein n=1 Tax=Bosea sp. (in: a-proteobacteria) TaxID=1871050 RepID=UPI002387FDA8|nr:hypothetical protein [Bosea sp. (in: a-proteobacteria)]MCP4738473.1 hypothetical protein [Bosea sp. (in: a-proteobacteria)]
MMRISVLAIVVLAAGCAPAGQPVPRDLFEFNEAKVYVDRFTGCQYLVITSRAITARLDAAGRPMCRPVHAPSLSRRTMQARDA